MPYIWNYLSQKKQIIIFLHILIFFTITVTQSIALSMNYVDSWSDTDGSTTDGVVWGSYSLKAYVSGVDSNADCLCWDWWDENEDDNLPSSWSDCICKDESAKSQCSSYYTLVKNFCDAGSCWVDSLTAQRNPETGSDGDTWVRYIDILEYRDCDNSAGRRGVYNHLGQHGSPSYVVNKKQYDCEGGVNYDFEAQYNYANWIDVKTSIACPLSYQQCSENHDDSASTSPYFLLDSPCRTKNGYECGESGDCISNNCAGSYRVSYRSHCDGTSGYRKEYNQRRPCCSSECSDGWKSCFGDYGCDSDSGYQCDTSNPENDKEYGPYSGSKNDNSCSPMANLCRRKDGFSCSVSSDCLTGHYCVHGTCRSTSTYCGDGYCDAGENWCEPDSCNPCAANQCVSYYWKTCHNTNTLCCNGDAVTGQYYCNTDKTWSTCSSGNQQVCQQKGSYYCTSDSNVWKWRYCTAGCTNGLCIGCKDYNADNFKNNEDTKESIKIYFNLPGKITGFTVPKAEVIDCIDNYP